MNNNKRSIIWKIDKKELEEVVKKSNTIGSILQYFNLSYKEGGNHKTLKKRLQTDCIDFSHIPLGYNSSKGRTYVSLKKFPLNKILIENSTYNRTDLKRRLLKENIIENKCAICGSLSEWNNKPLILILDHINGIKNDHRLENLRMLCPNCNSQLDTHAGKNTKIAKENKKLQIINLKFKTKNNICQCGNYKAKTSTICFKCRNHKHDIII